VKKNKGVLYMPYSLNSFKNNVEKYIQENIPTDFKILDVGPGSGTYSDLLKPYGYSLDCIEIWEPYVDQFNLKEKYQNVFIDDICSFDFSGYDYLILGDIFEHLNYEQASNLLNNINEKNIKCIISVPYNYEQGEYEGNVYETHLQPDLTHEIMKTKYPSLHLLYGDETYGYYLNYETLTTIANENICDKGTVYYEAHSYTTTYEKYIPRHKKITMLEIGVWKGDSIRMWNKYNEKIDLYAIDINPGVTSHFTGIENVSLHIGNQSDLILIDDIFKSVETFDVVVDDGSHNYHDIFVSYLAIFPKLKNGSIYFIEDLHAPHAEKERVLQSIRNKIYSNPDQFGVSQFSLFNNEKLLMMIKDSY
jgi:hypothetical protein